MASKSLKMTSELFHERTFQIAVVGAILFLIFAHPILFNLVDKLFAAVGIEVNDTLLTIVHSLVFSIALYYSIVVILKIET
jgi:hypothetical protein